MSLSGISPRTVTDHALRSTGATTLAAIRKGASSPARETGSSSGQIEPTPCLFGDMSASAQMDKKGLIVASSGTRVRTAPANSFGKQTQLLIMSGLVAGTTPLLIRKTSGLAIRDFASLPLDGGDAAALGNGLLILERMPVEGNTPCQ